jgi:hypothetical protein
VPFDERFTLTLGEALTEFVGLVFPHSADGVGASLPEALDLLCMLSKMIVQRCPLRSDRQLHGEYPAPVLRSLYARGR